MTNTALLVMDVQKRMVDSVDDDGYLPRLTTAIDAARAADVPVVHVVVGFRDGHPESNPRNKNFGALPAGAFTPADPDAAEHPAVQHPGDTVVTKKRVSAFAGSDLDVVLRSAAVDHLVLTGIATSGVVLSTVRQAADLDFELTVLSDACHDRDPDVHRVLTERVFPRQATVTTVDTWRKTLG